MFVIKYKNIFFAVIAFIMLVSIAFTFIWRPAFSIEFTGGSIIEGEFKDARPPVETINSYMASFLANNKINDFKIQPVAEKGIIIRTRDLTTEEHGNLVGMISDGTNVFTESNFATIGPSVGSELRSKAIISLALVLALIILFVSFAFRGASRVVSSWKFGLSVIICLVHDIFVPVGIFAVLSHYFIGYEIDTLFVTALLAILGYSVADTIVVFDRIRENLKNGLVNFPEDKPRGTGGLSSVAVSPFEEVVGRSLRETFARSINTSLTTILAALAIFFFGGEATKHFALMLAIGIATGTYSSILLASPLLVLISGKTK